ncbi:hypothetical protein ABZP36_002675 [Zizania latifolia]
MCRAFLLPGVHHTHEAANFASPAAVTSVDSPSFLPMLLAIGGYDPLQDWQRRHYQFSDPSARKNLQEAGIQKCMFQT